MQHKIRDGIVLKNICGEWLLIAVGDACDHCMYVRQINDTLAYYWKLLEKGKSTVEIMEQACKEYDAPAEVIWKDAENLIKKLYEMNYLVDPSVNEGEVRHDP